MQFSQDGVTCFPNLNYVFKNTPKFMKIYENYPKMVILRRKNQNLPTIVNQLKVLKKVELISFFILGKKVN